MNPFTFEAEEFEYGGPTQTMEMENPNREAWELEFPNQYEYEYESGGAPPPPPPPLAGAMLTRAVNANRIWARRIGWGCVVGGQVRPIPELAAFLGLAAGATEEDLARAIAHWQQTELHETGDGQLGPGTWGQMLRHAPPVIPAVRFKKEAWDVVLNGQKLGILEKTAPYLPINAGGLGGVSIQLGFRVTDMDAVRRAGFVDATGEDNFRWIQRIITNRRLTDAGIIRRHGRYVDPQSGLRDNHPYYWDNAGQGDPAARIGAFVNRQTFDALHPNSSRLCYDLIFEDGSRRALSEAQPGRRVYWNAEVALVGVRQPSGGIVRNVILNTVFWGFDLVVTGGVAAPKLNGLFSGPRGGSAEFKQVLSEAIRAGNFPNHCFTGGGFIKAATCA